MVQSRVLRPVKTSMSLETSAFLLDRTTAKATVQASMPSDRVAVIIIVKVVPRHLVQVNSSFWGWSCSSWIADCSLLTESEDGLLEPERRKEGGLTPGGDIPTGNSA